VKVLFLLVGPYHHDFHVDSFSLDSDSHLGRQFGWCNCDVLPFWWSYVGLSKLDGKLSFPPSKKCKDSPEPTIPSRSRADTTDPDTGTTAQQIGNGYQVIRRYLEQWSDTAGRSEERAKMTEDQARSLRERREGGSGTGVGAGRQKT
jgi:hypothetical protein